MMLKSGLDTENIFPLRFFFVKKLLLEECFGIRIVVKRQCEQQGDGALFLGRKIQSGGEVFPHKKQPSNDLVVVLPISNLE